MTAGQLVQHLKAQLPGELSHESYLILEHVSGISRQDYLLRREESVPEEQEREALACLARRLKEEPLQYIFGYSYFNGRKILVEPGALIPRMETELLALRAVELIVQEKMRDVLDLCCGTGCIGLTAACDTDASVTLGDISEKALAVCRKNAAFWGVSEQVAITALDALSLPQGPLFDLVICNPPYITEEEMGLIAPEVEQFEPRLALCGGKDGLLFYRAVVAQAERILKPGGWLLFEVGEGQAVLVSEMMAGAFTEVCSRPDLCGIRRMVEGRKNLQPDVI